MGTTGTSVRNSIRSVITSFGTQVTWKSYASATVVTTDEGDETITYNSGTAVTVMIGTNNLAIRDLDMQGEETTGDLVIVTRDDQTVAQKDKFVLRSQDYVSDEIKEIILQDEVVAKRVTLHRED